MGSKSNASIERFSMAIRLPMQPVQVTKVPNERKKEKNEKQKQWQIEHTPRSSS